MALPFSIASRMARGQSKRDLALHTLWRALVLILLGVFRWDPRLAALAATGIVLSAVYMLWMFQRVNYGEVTNPKNAALPDLSPREWATIGPAVAMAVVMGVFPTIFLAPAEPAVRAVVERIAGGQDRAAAPRAPQPAAVDPPHGAAGAGAHP